MDRKYERCSKIFGLIWVFFIIAACALFAQSSDKTLVKQFDKKIKEKSSAIDSIKNELGRGRKKIQELDKKEGAYLQQLEQLEKNIENSEGYLDRLAAKIADIGSRIGRVKDTLVIVGEALARRQQKMMKRLRSIYKTGSPQLIEILFTSKNMSDILSRIKYFQELGRYDKMLLATIDSSRTVIGEKKRVLEKQQEQYAQLKISKESERGELEKEKKKRKTVLADVTAEKKAYTAMVKELERAQEEMNLIVQKLRKKKKEVEVEYQKGLKVAFEKRKGKLPWPVDGAVVQEYGRIVHPVYKTVIMSNGIDIKAARGEKVFCVAPGRVDYIGWMRGYGKFIIINHFGGYLTVYAHLEKVNVVESQELNFGDEIGLTGETGSLNGVKLHFQIRHESETLNPQEWLEKKE